jgi:hypothetical protein
MFNTYNAGDTNLKINACSGGIYKTYKESWFINFHLDSILSNKILRKEGCYYRPGHGYSTDKYDLVNRDNRGLEEVKEVEILQMIICGDKEVIAEVILKEDFEKYFERSDT